MDGGFLRLAAAATALLALALGLAGAQAGLPLPELVLAAPALQPAEPREGDAVTFNVTLRNDGEGAASNVRVHFLVDGVLVHRATILALLPGERVNLSNPSPWAATPGAHAFEAVADPEKRISEGDKENNVARLSFEVRPLPDLRVASLSLDPAQPRAGEQATLTARVENAGNASAGAFRVLLAVDGQPLRDAALPGLEPGEEASVSAAWNATEGAHTFLARADWQGEVEERDERNNDRSLAVVVPAPAPLPDLVVEGLGAEPAAPEHGDDVVLVAVVRNVGPAPAPASRTGFRVDDEALGAADTPPLGPGASAVVRSAPWRAVAGSHMASAAADAAREVEEANEANNSRSIAFRVAPAPGLPDLVAVRLTLEPSSPQAGQAASLRARVVNGGAGNATAFTVEFLLDGEPLGARRVAGLAGGEAVELRSPAFTAEPGEHRALVQVDALREVEEQDEGDNEARLAFTVPRPLPDLFLEALEAEPAEPAPGQRVTFVATVRNAGGAAAQGFRVAFRVDDQDLGALGVAGLAPGASATLRSEPWTAERGARLARALADPGNEVAEHREDNNEATLPLPSLARLPNLVLERLAPGAEALRDGQSTVLLATVRNDGSARSAASSVRFVLDAEPLGDAPLPGLEPGARTVVASPSFTARAGSHAARALADPGDGVVELSEEENARDTRFEVASRLLLASQPRVAVLAVRVEPAAPAPGELARIVVEVENTGPEAAEGLLARVLVDGLEAGSRALPRLEPGRGAEASVPWAAEPGSHEVRAQVLWEGEPIAESSAQRVRVAAAEPAPPPAEAFVLLGLVLVAVAVAAWALARRRRKTSGA